MRRLIGLMVVVVCWCLLAGPALSVPKLYKHDQFSDDIVSAVNEINGLSLYAQPGYVRTEAFGQVYRPDPGDYPIEILSVQLVLAAPPIFGSDPESLTWSKTHATIKIWAGEGAGPAPPGEPIFEIHTSDLFDPLSGLDAGVPLQGNTAIKIEFDYSDDGGHPPIILDGDIWVAVEFTDTDAEDLSAEWQNSSCAQLSVGPLETCGCQRVGTLHDNIPTPQANILQVISPAGQCSGSNKQWYWYDEIGHSLGVGLIPGDIIMRLSVDAKGGGSCTPDCTNKECGADGCNGVCGNCGADALCQDFQCVTPCTPNCGTQECGSDGCGGSCGTCPDAAPACDDGYCCTPMCGTAECGDDGCGGSCGSCPGAAPICEDGKCVAACVPDCVDKECGDDGCEGSCGECPGAAPVCDEAQRCVPACVSDCEGKECGDDGCGGSCGDCPDSVPNCNEEQLCEALCVPDCADRECGDDGCGGSCGDCPGAAPLCTDEGKCISDCVAQCDGRVCGDDGCGGSCGTCAAGESCNEVGYCYVLDGQFGCGDGVCGAGETTANCPVDCPRVDTGGTATDGCSCDASGESQPERLLWPLVMGLVAMFWWRRRLRYLS